MSEQAVMAQLQRRYLQSISLLGLLLLASLAFESLTLLGAGGPRQLLSLGLNSALGGVYAGLMAIVLPAALLQSYREWYLTRSLRAPELSRLAWRSFWPWWLGLSALALLASQLPLSGLSPLPWPECLGLSAFSLGLMLVLQQPPQLQALLQPLQQYPLERGLFWLFQPLAAGHTSHHPRRSGRPGALRRLYIQLRPLQAGLLSLMLPLLLLLVYLLLQLPASSLSDLHDPKDLSFSLFLLQGVVLAGLLSSLLLASVPGHWFWQRQAEFYLTRPLPAFAALNRGWQALLALLPLLCLAVLLAARDLPLEAPALLALSAFVLLAGGLSWPLLAALLLSLQTPALLGSLLVLLLHSGWISLALWTLLLAYRLQTVLSNRVQGLGLWSETKHAARRLALYSLPLLAVAALGLNMHPLLQLLHLDVHRRPAAAFWRDEIQVPMAQAVQTLLLQGQQLSYETQAQLQSQSYMQEHYSSASLQALVSAPHAPRTRLALLGDSLRAPLHRASGRMIVCRQPVSSSCVPQASAEALKGVQQDYPLAFLMAEHWQAEGIAPERLTPAEQAELQRYQSLQQLATGELASALELAERSQTRHPSLQGLIYLAGLQRLQGNYAAALATYDRAEATLQLSPRGLAELKGLRAMTRRSAAGEGVHL